MLGWEFPPNISGGLGIASYQIVKSLRAYASITLLLPFLTQKINLRGVKIIGIGNLELEKIFTEEEQETLVSKYTKKAFDLKLSPYPIKSHKIITSASNAIIIKKKEHSEIVDNLLADENLYGENVIEKVQLYAEICERISKNIKFDIIHAHDWMTFPAAIAISKSSGKPLAIHIHSLNTDRIGPDKQSWIYSLEKNALELADLVIPVSKYTGGMIVEHYGIKKKKIFPIHNGIRRIKTFHSPKKFPEKLILFMGRLTYQKGPEYFLEVASNVITHYQNVRFVIAGAGDRFHAMIEESAFKDIGHKLHFTGNLNREKVCELLSMTDVFVMPSISEPFGLVALEAAQFGIPIIASKHSGAAEVLKGALLADFWDTELMATYIVNVLSDDKLRNKIIKQGFKDLEKLTWENTALKINEVYEKLQRL